jgi:hypothetical protein
MCINYKINATRYWNPMLYFLLVMSYFKLDTTQSMSTSKSGCELL